MLKILESNRLRTPPPFQRVAVLLALASAFAMPAFAATYYVAPGGNDSNSGTSPSSAWATIGKANVVVGPGDVVQVADGTYGQAPRPTANGGGDQRITFIGDLDAPSQVMITSFLPVLSSTNVTIKGFTFASDLTIAGSRDSVAWCNLNGDRPQLAAANDCVLANCTITAQRFWVFGAERDTLPKAMRDTLVNCVFHLNPITTGGHTMRFKDVEEAVVQHCRFLINVAAQATDASATKFFWVKRCKLYDNYWDVTNNCLSGCDEAGWFVLRDLVQMNSFVRDTIIMNGPGSVQFFGSASGSYPQSVMNNNFDHCVIKSPGDGPNGCAMFYQDGCRADTITHCVFVGAGQGLGFAGIMNGPMLIEHCTVVGFAPWRGAIGLDSSGPWTGTLTVRNNIFYTAFTSPRQKEYAPFFTNLAAATGHMVADNNLFYTKMVPDSAIFCAGLGASAPGPGKPWNVATGQDAHSTYGSPRFADSSTVRRFDAHLLSGSRAIGTGSGGSDAGAYPFASIVDTPPNAVSDLNTDRVSDTTAVLTWTAPADNGGTSNVAAYDLRMSLSPIDDASFAGATPVNGLSTPLSPGDAEALALTGLARGTTYYFAIKSVDDSGNWSPLSNVRQITTSMVDTVPPDAIKDLRVGP